MVLLIIDYFYQRKSNRQILIEKIPFLILSLIVGALIIWQRINGPVIPITPHSVIEKIGLGNYTLVSYLRKIILPLDLSALYPYPESVGIFSSTFYFILFLLLALWLVVRSKGQSRREIIFGIVFFLVTVFLGCGYIPVGDYLMADRYMYVPSVGIFFLLALGYHYSVRKANLQRVLAKIAALIMIAVFSFISFERCQVWFNGKTLWQDVLQKFPNETRALDNLAAVSLETGDQKQALIYLRKSLELKPQNDAAYNNLGLINMQNQEWDQAVENFRRAIQINPAYAIAYNNLGVVFMKKNQWPEAEEAIQSALKLNSGLIKARLNLAQIYNGQGKTSETIKLYETNLDLYPNDERSLYGLVELYFKAGEKKKAFAMGKRMLEISRDPEKLTNLASMFAQEKFTDMGFAMYLTAIKRDPNYKE